jgi:hypothetical protein
MYRDLELTLEQVSQAFRVIALKEKPPEELEDLTRKDWMFLANALESLMEEKRVSTIN